MIIYKDRTEAAGSKQQQKCGVFAAHCLLCASVVISFKRG